LAPNLHTRRRIRRRRRNKMKNRIYRRKKEKNGRMNELTLLTVSPISDASFGSKRVERQEDLCKQ
jgi:hypothetical protein